MKYINLKKTAVMIFSIFIATVFIYGCGENKTDEVTEDVDKNESSMEKSMDNSGMSETNTMTDNMNHEHIMISVSSMQCGTCKENIESAVNELDGIESIKVDKKEKVAHVNYDKSKVELSKIEAAITAAGYDANDKKADPKAYSQLDDCCKLPKDQKEKK